MTKVIKIMLFLGLFYSINAHSWFITVNIKEPRFKPMTDEESKQEQEKTLADLKNSIIFNKTMVVLQNEKRNQDAWYYTYCKHSNENKCN